MQGRSSVLKRGWLVLLLVVLTAAASASTAGAVIVHLRNGQTVGVTPMKGVSSTSIPGSVARSRTASPFSTSDNLSWHSGPVLHGVKPYLIFWDPSGTGISSADRALYERFFADSAAASGQSTNVWGVDRQFTDSTGFANYSQAWTPTQAINDTHAYPTTGQCTESSYAGETACLYDGQLQAEVQRLITASALPDGIGGQAPLYFIVTPPTVNTCFSNNSTCADNYYCAYHGSFTDTASHTVLYADMPTVLDVNDPKGCQSDNNAAVQAPNGASSVTADVVLKAVSHEESETITDPVNGTGWWNTSNGQEDGDQCNFTGAYDPANDANPNAFLPTLGGSAAGSPTYGTLYNQLINSNQYYIQSEWSNGDGNCQMQPTSSAISAAFTGPSTMVSPETAVNFDPTASSSAGGYTSTTWNFGDGSSSFSASAPALKSHTFSTPGNYTVTLTLVDKYGNLSTVSHVVQVAAISASFTATPTRPLVNHTVSLNGSASSDTSGTINSYRWNFGDGTTPVTTTGPTTTHQYTTSGPETITLTVGDGTYTDSTTHSITVDNPPSAAFTTTTTHPTATFPVSFNGSSSSESGGSIASYSWNFGDGSTGAGAAPSHTFAKPGTYNVVLTVTDQDGHTASVAHTLSVAAKKGVPTAGFNVNPAKPVALSRANFSGSPSTDIGSTLVSYAWNFGDGGTASGISAAHTYGRPGAYHVTLTVRDATGVSASSTRTVTVLSPGFTGVKIKTSHTVELIRLSLSGPGTLTVGRQHIRIRHAGVTTYRLVLSRAQRAKLRSHHRLHIKIAFRFAPKVGTVSRRTVAFTVKP